MAPWTSWLKHMRFFIEGPRLYQIDDTTAYPRNWLELLPDLYIKWMSTLANIVKWTAPIWLTSAYRRGYYHKEKMLEAFTFLSGVTATIVLAMVIRGLGRASNPSYRKFLEVLTKTKAQNNAENREQLIKYDFDFFAWPVDFDVRTVEIRDGRVKKQTPSCYAAESSLGTFLYLPIDVAGWIVAHTFGIRMTYPGAILSPLFRQSLTEARQKLIAEHGVERAKIVTENGLEIETLYVDRRSDSSVNRNVMVICCEGNGGFPEVGCPLVPLRLGYSVIGWNHPGFAGSTGMPYPSQEQEAIDAVVQFALSKLEFPEEDLIFYGWSIGGYTASWAAMNYPNARAVILDATFDNNEELSVNAMPSFLSGFVKRTVRRHICLDVDRQLMRYPGPILLIRRTIDEMIATENRHVSSNRGNFLLLSLLAHRFPHLATPQAAALLSRYLSVVSDAERSQILQSVDVNHTACLRLISAAVKANGDFKFPSDLGSQLSEEDRRKLLLFLATKYMENFEASHCFPLKPELFREPWSERTASAAPSASNGSGSDWERVDVS